MKKEFTGTLFGNTPTLPIPDEPIKETKLSPFDFIKSINQTNEDLLEDPEREREYVPYIVNRGLSYSLDTVLLANEMNRLPSADKKMQFEFLRMAIRKKKRYDTWIKAEKESDALKIVMEYYNYSIEKAKQVLPLLTSEQIAELEKRMFKGGVEQKTKGKKK